MRITMAEGLDYYLRSYNSYKNGWGLVAKPLITEVFNEMENFLRVLSVARSLAIGNDALQEVYDAIAEHSIKVYERLIAIDTELEYTSEVFLIAFQESFNSFLNYADDVDFRVFVTPFYKLNALQDIHQEKNWSFPSIPHYQKQYHETLKADLQSSYTKDYLEGEGFYEVFKAYRQSVINTGISTDFKRKD